MIAEGIKALAELVAKSVHPQRLDIKDPRSARFVVDGVVDTFDLPEPPRSHSAGSLADVVALANRFKGVVWYDHERVTLVIDDDGHRVEMATLALEPSDVWLRLVAFRKDARNAWLSHKDFLRLLRVDLAGTLTPGELLNHVKRVRFEAGQITSVDRVSAKGESLGREIVSKATGSGELDAIEQVTLKAPVFKTAGETDRYGVRCAFDIDPADETFRLLPLPDELERVRQLAVESIGERLAALDDGIPCYFGKP